METLRPSLTSDEISMAIRTLREYVIPPEVGRTEIAKGQDLIQEAMRTVSGASERIQEGVALRIAEQALLIAAGAQEPTLRLPSGNEVCLLPVQQKQ